MNINNNGSNSGVTSARCSARGHSFTVGSSAIHGTTTATNTPNTAGGAVSAEVPSTLSTSSGMSSTESVIEELKSLAKSMIEATNAARRRTHAIEQRNSYEALINAIGSCVNHNNSTIGGQRSSNGSGGAVTAASTSARTSIQSVTNRYHDPSMDGLSPEDLYSSAVERITDIPAELSPSCSARADAGAAPPRRTSLTAKSDNLLAESDGEDAYTSHNNTHKTNSTTTATSTAPKAPQKGSGRDLPPAAEPERGTTSESKAAHQVLVPSESLKHSTATQPSRGIVGHQEVEEEEDQDYVNGDETMWEGVRTEVLFMSTDPDAYRKVLASTWKPEPYTRQADGSSLSDGGADEDDAEEESNKDADDSLDAESSDGEPTVGHLPHRSGGSPRRRRRAKEMKVYRVPAFPYGGGVTKEQAQLLKRQFDSFLQHGSRYVPSNTHPALITKEMFDASLYEEIKADTMQCDLTSFQPQSPFEFVVEIERSVRFDPMVAREKRRRKFYELAEKGCAAGTISTFNLRIIMDPLKTGFEDERNFPIVPGSIIADRYEIVQLLGKATFSRAVQCNDLQNPIYGDEGDGADEEVECEETEEAEVEEEGSDGWKSWMNDATSAESDGSNAHGGAAVATTATSRGTTVQSKKVRKRKSRPIIGYAQVCLKIINNTKDFFDQSLDEIRLLTLLNKYGDPDKVHIVRLIDAFYYKEHMMLVTELLADNLYEYSKYNRHHDLEFYFTIPRLRRIAKQIVEALFFVHWLKLIHTDLKPENILFVSHSHCIVKVIDFGSSCFLSDHLSSYIQSRSYRAPEVVLGCDYDGRIDVWSLGAIMVELVTGEVLFAAETVPEMLARIVKVCGMPFPRRMLWEGRYTYNFINKFGCIYEYGGGSAATAAHRHHSDDGDGEEPYYLYTPVLKTSSGTEGARASKGQVPSAGEGSASPSGEAEGPYHVLRAMLRASNVTDEGFLSFVEACLTLDHKKRPTSEELLKHPFIADV